MLTSLVEQYRLGNIIFAVKNFFLEIKTEFLKDFYSTQKCTFKENMLSWIWQRRECRQVIFYTF